LVTVAVFTILAVLAIPSFLELRERMALRGAGGQLVSFWANAKLEAVKRHQSIAVVIQKSGNNMCMGATTVLTGCDCTTTGSCNIARYPEDSDGDGVPDQGDWRGVTMSGQPTLGAPDNDDVGLAVINPKRGYLETATDVGGATLVSAQGRYKVKMYVDRWARPMLCSPTDSPRTLSELADRTCAP